MPFSQSSNLRILTYQSLTIMYSSIDWFWWTACYWIFYLGILFFVLFNYKFEINIFKYSTDSIQGEVNTGFCSSFSNFLLFEYAVYYVQSNGLLKIVGRFLWQAYTSFALATVSSYYLYASFSFRSGELAYSTPLFRVPFRHSFW